MAALASALQCARGHNADPSLPSGGPRWGWAPGLWAFGSSGGGGMDEPAPWEDDQALAATERHLLTLAPELRTVYRHRYVEGLSQEQAARAIGISRQSLRTLEG